MLSEQRPENPLIPTAQVMWLRKRIQGLRILDIKTDWSNRRLSLGLGLQAADFWMTLDLRAGIGLESQPFRTSIAKALWPSLDEINNNDDVWQSFPHISPLLRKTLAGLPRSAASAVYVELQRPSRPEYFVYGNEQGPMLACPWRIPDRLRQGQKERRVASALEAAAIVGERIFFPAGLQPMDGASVAAQKKRNRLLQRLEADERRMQNYCKLAEQARLLQAELHHLPTRKRLKMVTLNGSDGTPREIALDPRKTVLENMEHWFRLANKGKRGLVHIRTRREIMLSDELSAPFIGLGHPSQEPAASPFAQADNPPKPDLPVHRFLSSDGFIMLRGKNKKANHALLTRLAKPFDYWFHAESGPGAHVIIKRNSPVHAVPEQSMREAAILAGLASHCSDAGKASVICAEVRNVRTIKGSPGQVRVERTLRTLFVDLDREMETRLKMANARNAYAG